MTTPNADMERKFVDAKAYLQTTSSKSGDNLYDHLAKVLTRLLTEKPNDAVDIFDDLSRQEKQENFVNKVDTLIDKPEKSSEAALAEIQKSLYSKEGEDEPELEGGEEAETPLPNLIELGYYFEQAGLGIGKEETFRIWLSLKQLVEKYPLESIRFWGKVFGVEENYYVAEVKFQDGKDEEEEAELTEEEPVEEVEKPEEEEGNEEEDPVPQIPNKPVQPIPKENYGAGSNKYVYYVCNAPGKPWFRLPAVTPQHISVARKIKKFFSGRLENQIVSYPPFNGNEANYLRAQIARISAGSQISPIGFYRFDEENEGGEEEEGGRDNFMINEEFEGMPVRELADPSLANWVHHVQHILPQGRTKWYNPKQKNEDEEMGGEDEEEEHAEPDEPEPEFGPQLLTPISEDSEIDGQPAWTARISSNLVPQFAISVIRSNLWPGAYAFGVEKKFENLYIGWGQKYSTDNLNPQLPPMPQEEFISGPEITEFEDPTPQEEAALIKAKQDAEDNGEEGEEENIGEEEEDEGDD